MRVKAEWELLAKLKRLLVANTSGHTLDGEEVAAFLVNEPCAGVQIAK